AASAEEFGALSHLKRRRLERPVRLTVIHRRHAPPLSAAHEKTRVAHAERRENVFPKIDFKRLVADSLHKLTGPIHADPILPTIARIELQRRGECRVSGISNIGHSGNFLVLSKAFTPDRVRKARSMGEQVSHGDGAFGRTKLWLAP